MTGEKPDDKRPHDNSEEYPFGPRTNTCHPKLVACLNFLPDMRSGYSGGYKQAGDLLIEHVEKTDRSPDRLVYPIVFMYRHTVELHLKDIIFWAGRVLQDDVKIPRTHRLLPVWEEAKSLLLRVWPDGSDEPIGDIENLVQKLNRIDPQSFAFRYSRDTKGGRSLPNDLKYLNLATLREEMERAYKWLQGAVYGLEAALDDMMEGYNS